MRRAALCVFVVFVLAVAPVGAAVSSGPLGAVSVAGDGAVGHQLEVPLGGTAGDPSATTPLLCGSWLSRHPCWITLTGPFIQVSVGAYHSCGLRDDSTIECWGSNKHGQTTTPQGSFVSRVSRAWTIRVGYAPTAPSNAGDRTNTGRPPHRKDPSLTCQPGRTIRVGYAPTAPSNAGGSNKHGQTTTPQGILHSRVSRGVPFVWATRRQHHRMLGIEQTRADHHTARILHSRVSRGVPFVWATRRQHHRMLGRRLQQRRRPGLKGTEPTGGSVHPGIGRRGPRRAGYATTVLSNAGASATRQAGPRSVGSATTALSTAGAPTRQPATPAGCSAQRRVR